MLKKLHKKIKSSDYVQHETKFYSVKKFIMIILIFIIYFIFISLKYGIGDGFVVSLLTWSFFVFCTPIADAGFLLDFPMRLITKIKMLYTEIFVWVFAFTLNLYFVLHKPEVYSKTIILKLFKQILLNPIPFWAIILLSCLGTFFSIHFGDELIDVAKHKHRKKYFAHHTKYKLIVLMFVIALILCLYYYLLNTLGIKI